MIEYVAYVGTGFIRKLTPSEYFRLQGNRVYSADHIAMCLVTQPVGNAKAKAKAKSILFDSAEKAASMGAGVAALMKKI